MKLRARLALTIVLVAVPIAIALAWLEHRTARRALLESTYEATVQRMELGGRDGCERRLDRPLRRGRPLRGPRRERLDAFDERYVPSSGAAPLEPALRRELEDGEPVAALFAGGRARIAMRMPFDGPCAVIRIERPIGAALGRAALLRALAGSLVVVLFTGALALAAMGPAVRRLRRLAREVRAGAASGFGRDVDARGRDEIAEVARAFNEASGAIRQKVSELDARDEALRSFVQSTSHDVMIPLTVLTGHLSRMREARGAPDPALLRGALDEAHYLGSLLRNLGAAARLDSGEADIHRHPIDLRDVIERVVARHSPIASQHGVSLEHAVPEQPAVCLADSTLAEQAVGNLVSNAIRYNREGGPVAVVLDRHGERFEIKVIDDGPGSAPEELERVRRPRERGDDARQRRPTGMGLGLSIVQQVADRHGWQLDFARPAEGGLEVTLRGPCAAGEGSVAPVQAES